MIREERDPGFWQRVAEHPEVAPHVFLGHGPIDLAGIVAHPSIMPLASEHGGFIFCRLDSLGRVWELHTLYTPEGWGREVLGALKAATERMFQAGAQAITTFSVEGWWRSRPPKSFGYVEAGDYAAVPHLGAALSTWVLTKRAWDASPARRRG